MRLECYSHPHGVGITSREISGHGKQFSFMPAYTTNQMVQVIWKEKIDKLGGLSAQNKSGRTLVMKMGVKK